MQVGDRVRLTRTFYKSNGLQIGDTGTITVIAQGIFERVISVDMDSIVHSVLGHWNFYESEVELEVNNE